EVVVAFVTEPTAPSLKTTVLCPATGSNPAPLIVRVATFAFRLDESRVTTGTTVATATFEALSTPSVVTVAVRGPALSGVIATVSDVAVAAVTVPAAPSVNVTLSLPAMGSKPKPTIVIDDAFALRFAMLLVTIGFTVATWTAVPLLMLSVVTTAVRFPALV